MWPIIGSEAVQSSTLTRGQIRWRYTALYPDVYIPTGTRIDQRIRALGAWLWSGRTGIIAGSTAADLHTASLGDDAAPVEMIGEHRRTPAGVTIRQERISDDEVSQMGELPLTSPARTALDLARRLRRDDAVIRLDQLASATGVTRAEIAGLVGRYSGSRGIDAARIAIDLMDGGATSARATRLRLALIDAGLPRPETNVSIGDDWSGAVIALGWPAWKVGVGFVDNRADVPAWRIRHQNAVQLHGWIELLVDDGYQQGPLAYRVRDAMRLQRFTRHRT